MNQSSDIRERIQEAYAEAMRVHEANKGYGSTALSIAYDAGRIDGLKQALELIDKTLRKG